MVEMQVQQALAFAEQALVVGDEVRIAPRLGDGHVEGLVQFRHLLEITAHHGIHVGLVGLADADQVLVAVLRCRQAGDSALDQVQGADVVGEFLDLEGRHQGRAVRQDGHQAFGDQAGQCIAHR
ncbi:hypothetical protein D3C76_1055710 [compost metagenome]